MLRSKNGGAPSAPSWEARIARAEPGTPVWYRDSEGIAKRAVVLDRAEGGSLWLFTDTGTTTTCAVSDLYETEAAVTKDSQTR
jgi:hypothetical protein